jgi:hypothetical protein
MRAIVARAATAMAILGIVVLPGCRKRGTFEKAGRKVDEAVRNAGGAAKEAADRLRATAVAAGARTANTAGQVGQDVREGAEKVGDVVRETAGNVRHDVQRGHALPAPTPTRAAGPRKPIKY